MKRWNKMDSVQRQTKMRPLKDNHFAHKANPVGIPGDH